MQDPRPAALSRAQLLYIGAALALTLGCGDGASHVPPTAPEPPAPPLPRVTAEATPSSLRSAYEGEVDGTWLFRVTGDLVLRETAGTGGRITRIANTVRTEHPGPNSEGTLTQTITLSIDRSIDLAPLGTVSLAHAAAFGIPSSARSAEFYVSFSGTDTHGRAFSGSTENFRLDLPSARTGSPVPGVAAGASSSPAARVER